MAWVKKASSPAYVNALARVRIAMGAGGDDWLLPWLNLLDAGEVLDVNAFCALGPPPAADFTIDDFLPVFTGGLAGPGASVVLMRDKIEKRAREVLFASLCEFSDATGETCVRQYTNVVNTAAVAPWNALVADIGSTVTKVKVTVTTLAAPGPQDMHLYWYLGASFVQEGPPTTSAFGGLGGTITFNRPAGVDRFYLNSNGTAMHIDVDYCSPGSLTPYVPDATEQPASAIPLDNKVYVTIADLGAELDDLERKLHWVLNGTLNATIDAMPVALVADETVEIADPDEDVALGPDVMGFIVTLASIPGSADERFGSPLQLHNLGRVVMGNGTAWLPPIPLSVTPMLLLKPDPSITVCRVHTFPPTTASVLTLVKPTIT